MRCVFLTARMVTVSLSELPDVPLPEDVWAWGPWKLKNSAAALVIPFRTKVPFENLCLAAAAREEQDSVRFLEVGAFLAQVDLDFDDITEVCCFLSTLQALNEAISAALPPGKVSESSSKKCGGCFFPLRS